MENMEMLVREVVMQSPGLAMGMSFQGLEWAWVAIVATIVLAFVSAKRVSIVSVGWTWGAKPGQVRVRVHSFSSMSDGSIVAASGMFSAEILNCSADSCSESDASSSSDLGVSDAASKVAAEVMFIFEKKRVQQLQATASRVPSPEMTSRKRTKSQDDSPKREVELLLPIEAGSIPHLVRREGLIQWDDASPVVDSLLPVWAHSLTAPLAMHPLPASYPVKNNTSSLCIPWDPLWKLRMRDAVVVCDRPSAIESSFRVTPLAPVVMEGARVVTTLANDVVRLWDSDTRSLMKSVHLPKSVRLPSVAFDLDWESHVVAVARRGGLFSIANLESATLEECYQAHAQSAVQSVHLDRSSWSKTVFTGGPATVNPGCSVSLWDSRLSSSSRQLSVHLTSATNVYGIRAQAHELYVRDEGRSVAAHDVRMLGAPSVRRVACENYTSGNTAPEDRWWDMEDITLHDNEVEMDVDDEFWDCPTTVEEGMQLGSNGGSGYVGSLVMAMSRNFSTKSPSK